VGSSKAAGASVAAASLASAVSAIRSESATAADQAPSSISPHRAVRATGTIQAVRFLLVQTPRISSKSSRMTLVTLVPNGSMVREGDPLAEFDQTEQLEASREAQAKY
jgi:multidrug efflux pump subunit AcrA (membrane-fusion protein)